MQASCLMLLQTPRNQIPDQVVLFTRGFVAFLPSRMRVQDLICNYLIYNSINRSIANVLEPLI